MAALSSTNKNIYQIQETQDPFGQTEALGDRRGGGEGSTRVFSVVVVIPMTTYAVLGRTERYSYQSNFRRPIALS